MNLNKFRFAVALGALLLLAASAAPAKTSWRELRPQSRAGKTCVRIGVQEFTYSTLDDKKPTRFSVRGPQRLKVVTRYVFGEEDSDNPRYVLKIHIDGMEELSKAFHAEILANAGLCGRQGSDLSSLRRTYVDVPTGLHDVEIYAETRASGQIAGRVFRESRGKGPRMVNFSPEGFDGVYDLQFASGSLSTYYHFSEDLPLRFGVIGPTRLQIDTRLDFDDGMSGSQSYELEILQDGEVLSRFFYHTKKLTGAAYVERPEMLAGERKRMRLTVPKGMHKYEIHCVGPASCGVAAKIRIPEADLQGK